MILAMQIEYNGASYAGWQRQINALTVQECIEKAIDSIGGGKISVSGAGRTDAGVHARGQVAHANLKQTLNIKPEKIRKALNANLPHDIRIRKAVLTDKFHARFDAEAREYSYTAIRFESVFLNHFATHFKFPFKTELLFNSAEIFLGRHDFTAFSKNNPDTKSYICEVSYCEWSEMNPGHFVLKIKADRFVYGMVRLIVGAMYDAARGKRTFQELRNALKSKERKYVSPLAPARGLVLEKIYYSDHNDPFKD